MKKIVICFYAFALLLMGIAVFTVESKHNVYALSGVVVDVNEEEDAVIFEDFNGNLWEFDGAEDWMINDICACVMNDKGTLNIYDDCILSVRYNGTYGLN